MHIICPCNQPLFTWANGIMGSLLVFNGQPVEGRSDLLAAFRLNPHDPRSARP